MSRPQYRNPKDNRYTQAAGGATISVSTPEEYHLACLQQHAGAGSTIMALDKMPKYEQGEVFLTIPGHDFIGGPLPIGSAIVPPGRLHPDATIIGVANNTDSPNRPGASAGYVGGAAPVRVPSDARINEILVVDQPLPQVS